MINRVFLDVPEGQNFNIVEALNQTDVIYVTPPIINYWKKYHKYLLQVFMQNRTHMKKVVKSWLLTSS